MSRLFEQSIETSNPHGYWKDTYDLEYIYQAFKDRLTEEFGLDDRRIRIESDENQEEQETK